MGTAKFRNGYPICYLCDIEMTDYDGEACYTCPECGNAVRIIDGIITWEREIFGRKAATYGGRTCEYCGEPLAGEAYTGAWENGNNANGYIKCPHCGRVNFEPDFDD